MIHITTVVPKHGMVVVLNNLDPSIYHEVTPLVKPNSKRFQYIANIGMADKPEWDIPFKSKPGFYSYKNAARLGDTDAVLEIIERGRVE